MMMGKYCDWRLSTYGCASLLQLLCVWYLTRSRETGVGGSENYNLKVSLTSSTCFSPLKGYSKQAPPTRDQVSVQTHELVGGIFTVKA